MFNLLHALLKDCGIKPKLSAICLTVLPSQAIL